MCNLWLYCYLVAGIHILPFAVPSTPTELSALPKYNVDGSIQHVDVEFTGVVRSWLISNTLISYWVLCQGACNYRGKLHSDDWTSMLLRSDLQYHQPLFSQSEWLSAHCGWLVHCQCDSLQCCWQWTSCNYPNTNPCYRYQQQNGYTRRRHSDLYGCSMLYTLLCNPIQCYIFLYSVVLWMTAFVVTVLILCSILLGVVCVAWCKLFVEGLQTGD